jgi:hypothetical protein
LSGDGAFAPPHHEGCDAVRLQNGPLAYAPVVQFPACSASHFVVYSQTSPAKSSDRGTRTCFARAIGVNTQSSPFEAVFISMAMHQVTVAGFGAFDT